nr:hypothetical protein Iba_chr04dCG12120 [Ipomoea batatas]
MVVARQSGSDEMNFLRHPLVFRRGLLLRPRLSNQRPPHPLVSLYLALQRGLFLLRRTELQQQFRQWSPLFSLFLATSTPTVAQKVLSDG